MTRPPAPLLHLLGVSPDRPARVVDGALDLLARVGVVVRNAEALDLLQSAGAVLRGDGRVALDERLVRAALSTAPREIELVGRDGQPRLVLGSSRGHSCFAPGSAAPNILDAAAGPPPRWRPATVADCVHLAWVTQACPHVEAQATALVPSDVAGPLADRYRLHVALCNATRPVVTGTFRSDGFGVMSRMLLAVRGDSQRLRSSPLAVFDCAPTSPLQWSDLTGKALIDCARAGIPAQVVAMPIAGATAPVTLREALVQHCAENLSGIAIHQLAAAGAPVIFGGAGSAMDMRRGTTPMASIEAALLAASYGAVGRHLGLPTHAYLALSDAKSADWQAGMETGVGAVLAAAGGIDLVSGPGMLGLGACQSLEKLLLDDEACAVVRCLQSGPLSGDDEGAGGATAELIAEAIATHGGHFLDHAHTLAHHRRQLRIPGQTIDRESHAGWQQAGSSTAYARAAAEVAAIVQRGNPAPIEDQHLRRELDELLAADARRLGVDLPATHGR